MIFAFVIQKSPFDTHPVSGLKLFKLAVNQVLVFVKHPASVAEKGFARDVTTIGHFGTGNLELTLSSKADVEKARHLIEISYEAN